MWPSCIFKAPKKTQIGHFFFVQHRRVFLGMPGLQGSGVSPATGPCQASGPLPSPWSSTTVESQRPDERDWVSQLAACFTTRCWTPTLPGGGGSVGKVPREACKVPHGPNATLQPSAGPPRGWGVPVLHLRGWPDGPSPFDHFLTAARVYTAGRVF